LGAGAATVAPGRSRRRPSDGTPPTVLVLPFPQGLCLCQRRQPSFAEGIRRLSVASPLRTSGEHRHAGRRADSRRGGRTLLCSPIPSRNAEPARDRRPAEPLAGNTRRGGGVLPASVALQPPSASVAAAGRVAWSALVGTAARPLARHVRHAGP